ncbi:hypothetical protein P170DRAFT_128528 [Aspergillus steynii IBT 23096]|uniref:Uncharacterized protein n=1 Tax=Aspergillus steynii IBT 23096 TaxID=1392250 RepID=A0A2I2GKG1_9EURO|nr:uncharacterized protein P170DRAFT_128528 [Aspergillus steynii IBT 23096]PLB53372.1 hypothetical protein P170DRAFT_128528 [Aspergillus steynii IBT 23096]
MKKKERESFGDGRLLGRFRLSARVRGFFLFFFFLFFFLPAPFQVLALRRSGSGTREQPQRSR